VAPTLRSHERARAKPNAISDKESSMATVEIQTPTLSGELEAHYVDPAGNGLPNIVRVSEPFAIDARWYIDGSFAPLLAGTWYLQAQFQSSDDVVGEFRRPPSPIQVTLDGRTGPGTPYSASIPLGGTFNLNGRDSQVYEVTVTLNYHAPNGTPGPMAAFVELGKLMVYA
jgi:hypothetical protein